MTEKTPIFIGIDVACAKGKRLPICCVTKKGRRIEPIDLPDDVKGAIPRGPGNIEIQQPQPFRSLAAEVAGALYKLAADGTYSIERIAIDAPAKGPTHSERHSERQLFDRRQSCFKTPIQKRWDEEIVPRCHKHLDEGGSLARIPFANMIWMRYGFELFAAIRLKNFKVIETYPNSIVKVIAPNAERKTKAEGYRQQRDAISDRTGSSAKGLEDALKRTVSGSKDDRLDAFMCAWVASLSCDELCAYGDKNNHDDCIWVPKR